MVLRNIVKIDEAKCNGCGQCVGACAEGAISIIDGKAKLVKEIYCDGLGACIGHCPQGAITIERRQADEFDEQSTQAYLEEQKRSEKPSGFSCPGMMAENLREKAAPVEAGSVPAASQLSHWPVQLKLVSPQMECFKDADLLVVADCVPFAMGDFHDRFLKGRSVVVGCPKLDDSVFYIEKLAAILNGNRLTSLTVIHMEVPCCSGLTHVAKEAIALSGTKMSFEDVTVGLQGDVIRSETHP